MQHKNLIIEKNIDLRIYPEQDTLHPVDVKNQFTIGDSHANPLKIIHFLIKQNVLNLSKEDFEIERDIFDKSNSELSKVDIINFIEILDNATINPVGMVRFLGDIFADRGPNDYFILKILETLNTKKVPFETLISNHDIEFITARETKNIFENTILNAKHTHSMLQMQELIKEGLITREDVLETFDRYYKPKLKLLSYSINLDKNQITLYSHAPVDYRLVKSLVNKLNSMSNQFGLTYQIEYQDESAEALAKTIDRINEVFSYYVQNNLVHTLCDTEIMKDGYALILINFKEHPLEFLMWNRFFKLENFQLNLSRKHQKGYALAYVYGHTVGNQRGNVFPLDNLLGKNYAEYHKQVCVYYEKNYVGKYQIHFSQDIPLLSRN